MKRLLTKFFIDEIQFSLSKKSYRATEKVQNYIDEIWSINLMDMSDFKILNIRRLR